MDLESKNKTSCILLYKFIVCFIHYTDIIEFDLDLSDYEIWFISGSPLNDTDGPDSRNAGLGIQTIELEEIDLILNENSVQISFYYEHETRQYDITYDEACDFVEKKDITNKKMFDEISEIFVDNYNWPEELEDDRY